MEQNSKKPKKRAGKVIHSAVTLHAVEKAKEIRARYGSPIDYQAVLRMFDDRKATRYPVQLQFVDQGIEPGLFARTAPISEDPDAGYLISMHAKLAGREDILPGLILYQLVLVNYGDLATANDAELFGATLLDMERDDYYAQIVEITDALWE